MLVLDRTAIVAYATLGRGAITVGELMVDVAEMPEARIGLPVLAIAAARLELTEPEDLSRLDQLIDLTRPIAVSADHGIAVANYSAPFGGDLALGQAVMVSDALDVALFSAEADRISRALPTLTVFDIPI
jgi:hypothetical protein